jgi:GT2 family glycosyltransferase
VRARGRSAAASELATLSERPLISVVMPVYDTEPGYLRAAIDSIRSQLYPDWELVIVDDGSTRPDTRKAVARAVSRDPRITARLLDENAGISAASNRGLELCRGELVAFLDHDDELPPGALLRVASEFSEREFDVAYSDQDKITADGASVDPFHKPDWSPVYALGAMYVGHLLVARRELISEAGGFDSGYDTIQDFELLLRLSERTDRIHHIPETLYHWRAIPGSIALSEHAKEGVTELQARAVNAHLRRRGLSATAAPHPSLPHRLRLSPGRRGGRPAVDLVRTARRNPARQANLDASRGEGEFIAFLGEDTEPVEPDWTDRLLLYAEMPGVGAVGPTLVRPDGRVDAAGFAIGLYDPAAPVMRGFDAEADGYYGSLSCAREVSAVGADCMMVRRSTFERLGGFEEAFSRQFADLDLCLRIRGLGESVVCTPAPRAIARTTEARRRSDFDVIDRALFVDRHYEALERGDPFYSRRFFPEAADYRPSPFSGDPQAVAMREAVG